jgi:hypothetical protein
MYRGYENLSRFLFTAREGIAFNDKRLSMFGPRRLGGGWRGSVSRQTITPAAVIERRNL